MHIGFDAKRLFNNFTGLGNYSRFLVRALADHYPENQYTLYSPKVKDHSETQSFLDKPFQIITPPGWMSALKLGGYWRSVLLGKKASRDGVNIFHGLSNELPASKPAGLKTVVTIHDLIFLRHPQYYNPVDVRIYKTKVAAACKSADRILAISKQTADDLVQLMNADPKKIRVVYQGCHPQFVRQVSAAEKEAVKKKYGLPERFLLNVGTLEERKNAMLILKALIKVDSSISLVLVGRKTSYQPALENFITEHHLQNRVHFIHNVQFSDLPTLYQMASVFVYPSRFEGFGIPIIEAITSGVPVIAATGSCLEEAGGPDSVYVDPDDEVDLAKNVDLLLSDGSLAQTKVAKSKEYIRQFSEKVVADEMMKVYSELAD